MSYITFPTWLVIPVVGGCVPFLFLLDFVDKTQNPLVPDDHFVEFSIPLLDDFVDGDRDELLQCPIGALRIYLVGMEQYHPDISGYFVSMSLRKERVSRNTISFWLESAISHTYVSTSDENCQALWIKALKSPEDCHFFTVLEELHSPSG